MSFNFKCCIKIFKVTPISWHVRALTLLFLFYIHYFATLLFVIVSVTYSGIRIVEFESKK